MNKKYLSILPSLCIMIIIFFFSHQPAIQSSSESSYLAKQVICFVETVGNFSLSPEQYQLWCEQIHTPIRKFAHITEYAILAISVLFPFYLLKGKKISYIIYTILICIFYAATDEFHQLFIAGRSGQLIDVGIDSIGILMGSIVFYLCFFQKTNSKAKTIL